MKCRSSTPSTSLQCDAYASALPTVQTFGFITPDISNNRNSSVAGNRRICTDSNCTSSRGDCSSNSRTDSRSRSICSSNCHTYSRPKHAEWYKNYAEYYDNEGKYGESVITFSIARLESPHWEFAQLGIADMEIAQFETARLGIRSDGSLIWEFTQPRIVHMGIGQLGIRSSGNL
uniref:Uncharacterized protein n=1 Tax=Romanomermis culicivorax TaxID=13658 RepID=A0A915I047_ROMCU